MLKIDINVTYHHFSVHKDAQLIKKKMRMNDTLLAKSSKKEVVNLLEPNFIREV